MRIKEIVLATCLVLASIFSFSAAADSKVFDTVTWFKLASSSGYSSIGGTEKNTGTSITATFSNICTSLVLTAMEKSGRYNLKVTWSNGRLDYCELEVKPQPN